jgi:hypothetical protein
VRLPNGWGVALWEPQLFLLSSVHVKLIRI